jgi:hypothetical protein
MSQIFPKMIDNVQVDRIINPTNDFIYIKIAFSIFENINFVDETWDSQYSYTYVVPETAFNYMVITDASTGVTFVNCKLGDNSINFAVGEYVNITGNPYDLQSIVDSIQLAIGV